MAVARRQSLRATVFVVVRVSMSITLLVDCCSAAPCQRSPQLTSPDRRSLDGAQRCTDHSAAGHARYLGATPSRAVAGVEKDRSSYCPPSGMKTASRAPSSNVVDLDFQCVRTISSPDM